jgi:DNA-binding MarR family transcriptional regulator
MSSQIERAAGGGTGGVTVPDDVSSPRAKLVYVYLRSAGRCTTDDLRQALGIRTISLHPVLDALRGSGHVERRDGAFVAA